MASKIKSLVEELMSLVSPHMYTEQIECLDTDDFMPLKSFQTHDLSDLFVIDWSTCIINGEINNEHLFSTLSQFSDEDPESVRTDIIETIKSGKHIYNAVGVEFLGGLS